MTSSSVIYTRHSETLFSKRRLQYQSDAAQSTPPTVPPFSQSHTPYTVHSPQPTVYHSPHTDTAAPSPPLLTLALTLNRGPSSLLYMSRLGYQGLTPAIPPCHLISHHTPPQKRPPSPQPHGQSNHAAQVGSGVDTPRRERAWHRYRHHWPPPLPPRISCIST